MTGKLNGVIPAQTPSGSRKENTSTPVETWSEYSPLSSCGMPQANSIDLEPALHLAAGVGDDLAVLVGDDLGEFLGALRDQLAEREQDLRALRERRLRPRLERGRGGPHRGVDVGRRAQQRPRPAAPRSPGSRRGWCASTSPAVGLPPIQWLMVLMKDSFLEVSGRCDALVRRRSVLRAWRGCGRAAETSATGTSHQLSLDGHGRERVGLDVHDGGAGRRPGPAPRASRNSAMRAHPEHVGAEARGVGGQVDRAACRRRAARCRRRGSGSGCRSAASRATPTAPRSRRTRGSAPGRRSA